LILFVKLYTKRGTEWGIKGRKVREKERRDEGLGRSWSEGIE